MKIVDVLATPGFTGFYFDDQKAIKMGAEHDGMFYIESQLQKDSKKLELLENLSQFF